MNTAAFRWGRRAAVAPEQVRKAAGPQTEATPRRSLDELIAHRAGLLVAYQDAAYAERYTRMVERVRTAEAPLGSTALTEAVARYLYKLMAYKDEYEVARLYSDPAFWARLDEQFEGDYQVHFNLAPTFLARPDPATGRIPKQRIGPWLKTVLGWLPRLRRLRGSVFDPFGHHPERKAERALIAEYEADLERILPRLSSANLAQALGRAQLPEEIRGYGPVKMASIEQAARQREALMQHWR
jgi:indolepyruvate ferredoxin oxidoreductase